MTGPKDKDRIPDELIDQLLSGYKKPEDLTGETGILKQLTARLIERAMQAEMTEHLGYEKHAPCCVARPMAPQARSRCTFRGTEKPGS